MALEIERRFLIEQDIAPLLEGNLDHCRIEQSYVLDTGGWVTRIRLVQSFGQSDRFFLTMKRPAAGFSSHEIETPISRDVFRQLEGHTGPTLIKQRHRIPLGELVIEVDLFRNFVLKDVVIAEVELPAEDHAFDLPDWFGREITGEKDWSNVALAQRLGPRVRGQVHTWTKRA